MNELFGTDGVRGMANKGNMTAEMVLDIGRAVAYTYRAHHVEKGTRPLVVVGKDTRLSGDMLENALTAGLTSMGTDVCLMGVIPTSAVAFATRDMRADAGIMLSASHNPFFDNGIKIFSRTGHKLSDEMEREIERLVLGRCTRNIRTVAEEIGKPRRIDDAAGRYIVFCKNTLPGGTTLDSMKVVLDCSNGATCRCAPAVFAELGADVRVIHADPNGININLNCGSQHTEDLCAAVSARGAMIGLAFDGDGDRLIAVDEKGRKITGDQMLAICAKQLAERGALANRRVVATVMSGMGFHAAMQALAIEVVVADVGDRKVSERMLACGAVLGGEDSGHLVFHNLHTTGDGIISALQLLTIMCETGRPLSELAEVMAVAPQALVNVEISSKPPLEKLEALQKAAREAEKEMNGKGRILIRYSGTQPVCRVMVEGSARKRVEKVAAQLAGLAKDLMG